MQGRYSSTQSRRRKEFLEVVTFSDVLYTLRQPVLTKAIHSKSAKLQVRLVWRGTDIRDP